jgi:hypothetical protein
MGTRRFKASYHVQARTRYLGFIVLPGKQVVLNDFFFILFSLSRQLVFGLLVRKLENNFLART